MSATADRTIPTGPDERWRTMTPAQASCGKCDKSPSGEGAETVVDNERGLIVACADCLPGIRKAARRTRERARRDRERRRR